MLLSVGWEGSCWGIDRNEETGGLLESIHKTILQRLDEGIWPRLSHGKDNVAICYVICMPASEIIVEAAQWRQRTIAIAATAICNKLLEGALVAS